MIALALLLSVFFPNIGNAEPKVISWNENALVFNNENCTSDNTCDLKKFWIETSSYKVRIDNSYSYGTALKAGYETSSLDALEKYALVQFIRGCHFESIKNPDDSISKVFSQVKQQFNKWVPFVFYDWVIDSVDEDPIYNSDEDLGRYYFYRWNDNGSKTFFGEKKPETPALYVVDHPGTAYVSDYYGASSAYNLSEEFKMCIYKIEDIPVKTTQDNVEFAKPIHCFYWNSSFIYNQDTKQFESKDELDPFCRNAEE